MYLGFPAYVYDSLHSYIMSVCCVWLLFVIFVVVCCCHFVNRTMYIYIYIYMKKFKMKVFVVRDARAS